jgi:PucR family transcriptional regulator, purine catabolism regulatory protein
MKNRLKVTVGDILSRPHFHKAKIIAGKKGLDRLIRWVHIMEVTEIGQLINGNELILSTGVGWREDPNIRLSFLKQLIDRKASGLCVELGKYISAIPKEMINVADEHNFPIIVFPEEVRFIDITQDLNSLFIDVHYNTMVNLESISNQFNKLLLSADGFKRIIRLLHQSLNVQVAYVPVNGQIEYYPALHKVKEQELLPFIQSTKPHSIINQPTRCASKPIQALGHKFADLFIISTEQDLTDFDFVVLDRAATALSQDQLRLLYVEEKRKQEKNRWLLEWIKGEHTREEIVQHLSSVEPNIKVNGCTICICKVEKGEKELDLTYASIIFRKIIEQHGFYSFVHYDGNEIIYVLINQRNHKDWKTRFLEALHLIKEKEYFVKNMPNVELRFAVGKLYEIDHIHKSYDMAKETLFMQKKIGIPNIYFYEDLYIYRLIYQLQRDQKLNEFIEDYIGPVISFDKEKNGHMLETLKVYLEVNGSKKDAAERLFVVRQTLYHRIEKLKELLGDDFMKYEKRLAIEFAVRAKEFLDKMSLT